MNKVELQELVGGALQEKFNKAFERVIENLQDVNTSFKVKRKITITLDFTQNEIRDDVHCDVAVVEELAPQAPMSTSFSVGKNLKTGEMFATEYGKQIKGQMSINDYVSVGDKIADAETGEIIEEPQKNDNVVDFRKVNSN